MADFYILYSSKIDAYYVGSSNNAEARLIRHNTGHQTSTRKGIPWKLVHKESFPTRADAYTREYEVKRKKSRKYIEGLLA